MNIKILNRWTLKVIFECEADSMKAAVELAYTQNVDLRGANLSDANLRGANLIGSDLSGANLSGANLIGSDLIGSDLSGANLIGSDLIGSDLSGSDLSDANLIGSDLRGANLSDANLIGSDLRGANLSDANLRGANLSDANLRDANLSDANLRDANLRGSDLSGIPKIPNIHQAVHGAASQPGALNMGNWHSSCGTSHCRAGWVVTLAGEGGKALEWAMGTATAATLIYLASDPERWKIERLPDFYCGNDEAIEDMKRMAEEEFKAQIA
ncbi:hypothetical protein WS62_23370 [Burkholderia sp. ABCPW 14]|uniref:pentapeptide repeat-containing protein n=1 Tax=Burkholderia sp. ABCPW 14 TaxID=1637860 RepID=UPI000770DCD8|nr:pentapeptide repeat-containing protein [Burkholderia sp. ABCPW 14]KVD81900.1 hypothetical protein WS62_23370 [Burkholderia sp. ABCPW 14]